MDRFCVVLVTGALLMSASAGRAENAVAQAPTCALPCCAQPRWFSLGDRLAAFRCRPDHGCLRQRLVDWITHRPLTCSQGGCCADQSCTPPLYTFFLANCGQVKGTCECGQVVPVSAKPAGEATPAK